MFNYTIVLSLLLAGYISGDPVPNDPFIVGGEPAEPGEIPFIVSLQYQNNNKPFHFCGGSVLDSRTILTAAHCMVGKKASDITVRAGSLYPYSGGTLLNVSKIIINEDYIGSGGDYSNDVSLLILSTHIAFNRNISTIRLPAPDSNPAADKNVRVAGWGRLSYGGQSPTQLLKVDVNIVARQKCKEQYLEGAGLVINKFMVCAGVAPGGKGACNGDSGGPLFIGRKQIGIVSFSSKINGCAGVNYPNVYTRVSKYIHWINANRA